VTNELVELTRLGETAAKFPASQHTLAGEEDEDGGGGQVHGISEWVEGRGNVCVSGERSRLLGLAAVQEGVERPCVQ